MNTDLAAKIARDLAAKHGTTLEPVAHAMRAGYDLACDEIRDCSGRGALANTFDPQVACAVLRAVPGVALVVTGRGLEIRAGGPVDDRALEELRLVVQTALRAAEAMRPEPPPICDSCRKDPPCSKCGHLPRRY